MKMWNMGLQDAINTYTEYMYVWPDFLGHSVHLSQNGL